MIFPIIVPQVDLTPVIAYQTFEIANDTSWLREYWREHAKPFKLIFDKKTKRAYEECPDCDDE